jgi:hypothetical protein
VSTTLEAVALGHLATHVDDLAVPGKPPENSANSERLKLLDSRCSSSGPWCRRNAYVGYLISGSHS